jgi:hypothetical protein
MVEIIMKTFFSGLSIASQTLVLALMVALGGSMSSNLVQSSAINVASQEARFLVMGSDLSAVVETIHASGAPIVAQLHHLHGIESLLSAQQVDTISRSTAITRIVALTSQSSLHDPLIAGSWWNDLTTDIETENGDLLAGSWWNQLNTDIEVDQPEILA